MLIISTKDENNTVYNVEMQRGRHKNLPKRLRYYQGSIKDLSEELLEFLAYVENSTDDVVTHAKGNLVKSVHKRVQEVKNDISVEVEFMTLLERDREKIEEGREEGILLTKKVLKLSTEGYTISQIAKECNISEDQIKKILE